MIRGGMKSENGAEEKYIREKEAGGTAPSRNTSMLLESVGNNMTEQGSDLSLDIHGPKSRGPGALEEIAGLARQKRDIVRPILK